MMLLSKGKFVPSKEELILIENLKEELKDYLENDKDSSCSTYNVVAKFCADEELLLKYIRGRKQNIQVARDSIIRYAQVSCEMYPELFTREIPDYVRYIFKQRILTVFRHTDSKGRLIIHYNASAWDSSVVSLVDIICAGRYMLDALMDFPDLFGNGAIFVGNAANGSSSHFRHYTVPTVMKVVNIFMRSYPISIKGIYYVNIPFIAIPLSKAIKPLLPAKLRKRILLTNDMAELHCRIPVQILPKSLGGVLSEEGAMSLSFLNLPC